MFHTSHLPRYASTIPRSSPLQNPSIWCDIEAIFRKYRFRAIPIVDDFKKIVGVIREKDVFLAGE